MFFFIVAILIGCTIVVFRQEVKINEMKRELSDYQNSREQLMVVMKDLQRKVDVLDTDKSKESLAREKLNMIKSDEILYIIKYEDDEENGE